MEPELTEMLALLARIRDAAPADYTVEMRGGTIYWSPATQQWENEEACLARRMAAHGLLRWTAQDPAQGMSTNMPYGWATMLPAGLAMLALAEKENQA